MKARVRPQMLIVILVAALLLTWVASGYILSHRQASAVSQSVKGVVESIGSQKVCLQPSSGDQVCGVLALQPGVKTPAQGEVVTVQVYEVPVTGAKDGTPPVTFLIITDPTLPT